MASLSSPRPSQNKRFRLRTSKQSSDWTSNNKCMQDLEDNGASVIKESLKPIAREKPDAFFRVIFKKKDLTVKKRETCSNQQSSSDATSLSSSTGEKKRLIFGETDYLKEKLGFCMPSVNETLASEHLKYSERHQYGYRNRNDQRMDTIQRILFERTLFYTKHQFYQRQPTNSTAMMKDMIHAKHKLTHKKTSEAQRYLVFLDVDSRRAKQLDDRTKFAVMQEMARCDKKNQKVQNFSQQDEQSFSEIKSYVDKEKKKEQEQRIRDIEQKRVRIMEPESSPKDSDSDCTF